MKRTISLVSAAVNIILMIGLFLGLLLVFLNTVLTPLGQRAAFDKMYTETLVIYVAFCIVIVISTAIMDIIMDKQQRKEKIEEKKNMAKAGFIK